MPHSCLSGLHVEMLFSFFLTATSIMEFIYILILSVINLEPPTTALCFSFESTHNYSKDLSREQKIKNLSVSLARRHQKMECYNFMNNQLTPDSHLLFATGKKFSVISSWRDNETVDLHIRFQGLGLFSWVTLKVQIFRLSVSEQNIKLKSKQYLHITLIL